MRKDPMTKDSRMRKGHAPWGMGLVAGVVGIGVLLCCRPKGQANPPLCSFQSSTDEELGSQSLAPEQWLPIISPSIDRVKLSRTGPLRDACGRVLVLDADPWPACPGVTLSMQPRAGDPIEASDLIVGQVGESRMIVWAATEELQAGDAMGPAALVFWTETGLDVHAVGSLRGIRDEARLRLHHTSGVPVVIIEGQQCETKNQCTSMVKFVPIVARRFVDVPVVDPQGACLGDATFPLHRKYEESRSGKVTRRFELERTVELGDDGIYLVDLVTGDEFSPRDPVGTTKQFRRVTARRKLEFVENRFVIRERDLWEHIVQGVDSAAPRADEDLGEDDSASESGDHTPE